MDDDPREALRVSWTEPCLAPGVRPRPRVVVDRRGDAAPWRRIASRPELLATPLAADRSSSVAAPRTLQVDRSIPGPDFPRPRRRGWATGGDRPIVGPTAIEEGGGAVAARPSMGYGEPLAHG